MCNFDDTRARALIERHGLSKNLLHVWRKRGAIPARYDDDEVVKARNVADSTVSVRFDNDLLPRLAVYRNRNRFINQAVRERLDRLDALEQAAKEWEDAD